MTPEPLSPLSRTDSGENGACPNCGHGVTENFCANCGQENHPNALRLRSLLAEFLDNTFSWDSKIFRTILPLLFRPGFLTNEYNAGRRARYISPFRTYLVATLVFFTTLSLLPTRSIPAPPARPEKAKAAKKPIDAKRAEVPKKKRTDESATGKKQATLPGVKKINLADGDIHLNYSDLPETVAAYDAAQKKARVKDPPWKAALTRKFIGIAAQADREGGTSIQKALASEFQEDAPKALFFLMPVFALLLKISFRRQKRFYVEHLIFALHVHAFVFLVFTLIALVSRTGVEWPLPVLSLGLLVYPFIALRMVYRQPWWKILLKGIALSNVYGVFLVLASVAILLLAFWHLDFTI